MMRALRTTPCGCSASPGMHMHLRALPKTNSTPGSIPTVESLEWVTHGQRLTQSHTAYQYLLLSLLLLLLQLQLLGAMPSSRGVPLCILPVLCCCHRCSIFNMFDTCLLLGSNGHVVYSGPQRLVQLYMAFLGFYIPPRENLADFLLDVTAGKHCCCTKAELGYYSVSNLGTTQYTSLGKIKVVCVSSVV